MQRNTGRLVIGVVLAGLALGGCTTVATGYRGIETRFGKVIGQPLSEGLYFYNPVTTDIVKMVVQERRFEMTTEAYTRDVQQSNVSVTVTYYPERNAVHTLFQEIGRGWENVLIPQVVLGKLKSVIGQYEAVELVAKRTEAVQQIESRVREELAPKHVVVTKVELTNLDYADQFENAVEAKVVAIQKAEEARNETVRVQERANQQIISAKAEAESMRIRTDALSANKGLVEYEAVQKWNGQLPTYMMGSSVPFLNLQK